MGDKDPKGYYRTLGISPDATLAEIKKAYRRLAIKIHPDRNSSPDATKKFQELTQAYEVLKDARRRAEYDSLAATSGDKSKERPHDEVHIPEPIPCSVCGKPSAQPFYSIFYKVKSFLVVSVRSPIQGIHCRSCAAKASLRATVVTWLLGWWGIPWGPILSVHAIFVNLFGGIKPKTANSKILAYQAWCFARLGHLDLAKAIAMKARKYAEGEERAILDFFISAVGNHGTVVNLNKRAPMICVAYGVQALLLIGVSVAVATYIILSTEGSPGISDRSAPPSSPAPTIPLPLDAVSRNEPLSQCEACEVQELLFELRVYQGNIDGLIGRKTQDALRTLSEDTGILLGDKPTKGLLFDLRALYEERLKDGEVMVPPTTTLPANGQVFHSSGEPCAPLRIKTPQYGWHFFVKVADPVSNRVVKSFFVRSGHTAETKVPLGRFEIKFATGNTWYGTRCLFGRKTAYNKAQHVFDFYVIGNRVSGYTVELISQVGGNLQTEAIDPSEF